MTAYYSSTTGSCRPCSLNTIFAAPLIHDSEYTAMGKSIIIYRNIMFLLRVHFCPAFKGYRKSNSFVSFRKVKCIAKYIVKIIIQPTRCGYHKNFLMCFGHTYKIQQLRLYSALAKQNSTSRCTAFLSLA